jgi:hypothetical protein
MALIGKGPTSIFFSRNDGKVVPILEHEGSKNTVTAYPLRSKPELLANLFSKILFDVFDGHYLNLKLVDFGSESGTEGMPRSARMVWTAK